MVWSADRRRCPGALTITSATTSPILGRSKLCPFWHAVDTFFPAGRSDGDEGPTNDCADVAVRLDHVLDDSRQCVRRTVTSSTSRR